MELLNELKGPTHLITDMRFGPIDKDDFLSCCSVDGFFYEWSTYDWNRRYENCIK